MRVIIVDMKIYLQYSIHYIHYMYLCIEYASEEMISRTLPIAGIVVQYCFDYIMYSISVFCLMYNQCYLFEQRDIPISRRY